MKKLQLEKKKFGKLIVVERSQPIHGGKLVKRTWGAWKFLCDCGKTIIVKTIDLNRGSTTSCGCLVRANGKSLLPNQKINKLTTIAYENGKWLCRCDCGEVTKLSTNTIISGNTKSCGCLKSIANKEKIEKLHCSVRKFDPKTASARRIWKSYCYRDKNCCTISFEEFLNKSQNECYYCGIYPNNSFNYFLPQSSRGSEHAKKNGEFKYNGLDRIDPTLHYTLDNTVSCCYQCNKAKNNSSTSDFLIRVNSFEIRHPIISVRRTKLPDNKYMTTSIKCVFYNYKPDSNLDIEEFYYISQMPCFYCGNLPNNAFNRAKTDKKSSKKAKELGRFIYNGVDRIDSNLPHNKENVVPCCKYCNFAKGNITLEEFQEWMRRVKSYQKKQ